MTLRQIDPLLALGKGIVLVGQALTALAALALVIAVPVVALFPGAISVEVRADIADPAFVFPTLAVIAIALLALAMVALVFLFLENLRRIIATVGEGDPFLPVNARRLSAMAWLMLAAQLLTIPMAPLGIKLLETFEVAGREGTEFSFDFGAIILVVTLFILARVFRQGAEMRSELEGTV